MHVSIQSAVIPWPPPPHEAPAPNCPWCIPVFIDSTVHLCLQLVGASADRTAVPTGPQGPRIILKVLQAEGQGGHILKEAPRNLWGLES